MSFDDILKEWEKGEKKRKSGKGMDYWMQRYPPGKETEKREEQEQHNPKSLAASRRSALRVMKCQGFLDLHGLSAAESLTRVDTFLKNSVRDGLRKVLIIHGKGIHSKNGPVLGDKLKKFIERSPLRGNTAQPIGISAAEVPFG